jgi:hypothetical protein
MRGGRETEREREREEKERIGSNYTLQRHDSTSSNLGPLLFKIYFY